MAISLEKIEKEAPALLNLSKIASVQLAKHKLLDTTINVGLVLDASGSMGQQYVFGNVQEIINRVLPLAVNFDDNKKLEVWAFSDSSLQLPRVSLSNFENYINTANGGFRRWNMMRGNNEPAVIKKVIESYKSSKLPTFIIFISDGGVHYNAEIETLLRNAAKFPIFWQFVGIGGDNYGVLKRLDTMGDRVVDNCNFFELSDLNDISEDELYDRLLTELPVWLEAIKTIHIPSMTAVTNKPWWKFW